MTEMLDWKATLEQLNRLQGQIVAVGVTDRDFDLATPILEAYGRLQPDPDDRGTFLLVAGAGGVTVTTGVVRLSPRAFENAEWDGEMLLAVIGTSTVGVKVVG